MRIVADSELIKGSGYMKKKIVISLSSVAALILVAVLGLLIFFNIQHPPVLKFSIDPSQVSKINVYYCSVRYSELTERNDIEDVVKGINKINLKRGESDQHFFDYMKDDAQLLSGSARIEMLDKNNKTVWNGIFFVKGKFNYKQSKYYGKIMSQNLLLYNGYFYPDINSSIDFATIHRYSLGIFLEDAYKEG